MTTHINRASQVILIIILLCLHSGCVSQTPRRSPRLPKPVDYRQPTAWEIDDSDLDNNARSFFTVSTNKTTRGAHELVLKGAVSACYYSYTSTQTRKVPTQHFDRSSNMWKQSWKVESQTLSRKKKHWRPRQLRISNPFGGTVNTAVSESGAFETRLQVPANYYLQLPKPENYLAPARSTKQFTIGISADGQPHGGNFKTSAIMPALWQYALNTDKARQYVKDNICTVDLRFKDSTSRKSIMPKVVVTGVEPNKKDIEKLLSVEFGGHQELIEIATEEIYRVLFEAEKKTSITSNIRLKLWKSGQCKIEATHGRYHYFSTPLELGTTSKVRKDILLVEKGEKIRVENLNEGETGSMVDVD